MAATGRYVLQSSRRRLCSVSPRRGRAAEKPRAHACAGWCFHRHRARGLPGSGRRFRPRPASRHIPPQTAGIYRRQADRRGSFGWCNFFVLRGGVFVSVLVRLTVSVLPRATRMTGAAGRDLYAKQRLGSPFPTPVPAPRARDKVRSPGAVTLGRLVYAAGGGGKPPASVASGPPRLRRVQPQQVPALPPCQQPIACRRRHRSSRYWPEGLHKTCRRVLADRTQRTGQRRTQSYQFY